MALLLSVVSSFLVGLVLALAPWTEWWDTNPFIQAYPLLRAAVLSAFTRGAVTGLGLLNVVLGIQDLREHLTRTKEPF